MKIVLENVSKAFNHNEVLENTTLCFRENQTTALIGPSGCGKSTLLQLIVGLIKQTTGHIYFDQSELTPSTANTLRQKIGYVIQDGGLFPHLTAYENITLLARTLGYDPIFIRDRYTFLCELMQLPSGLFSLYPYELSGGQRQRISLMRALLLDPPCILLDEPFAALDPLTKRELQIQLKDIFSKLCKTAILVTHDMQEAAYFSDEIILMKEGRIVQRGSYQELLNNPKAPFVSEFIKLQELSLPNNPGIA